MTKSSKATQEALEGLHGALAKLLTERIASGTASAADLAVARQFLKDNGIDAIPKEGSPLGDLVKALPFATPEGVAEEEGTRH